MNNFFKPSIFYPLAAFFSELIENPNDKISFNSFVDANYDITESFEKDTVKSLFQEYGTKLIFKDLADQIDVKKALLLGMILNLNPDWFKLLKNGRQDFFDSIQSDNQNIEIYQLFKDAQLDDLSMDTILWWAYIETTIKNDNWDKRKLGTIGEYKTLQYEEKKIKELGITKDIIPTCLDDTNVGYDFISWRKDSSNNDYKIYIEAKLNSRGNKSFFLSRNEFNKCQDLDKQYFIYLWEGEDSISPNIINSQKIFKNVPTDKGGSTWKETFIQL